MKYTVRLKYFEDDNGNWGFTHIDTFNSEYPFDAFWSAHGIVHDVLEHWFEGQHRYFRGRNMCNVHGEMVASAMRVWMRYNAGFDIFELRNRSWVSPTFFEDTEGVISEFINEEYSRYPVEPLYLPYQKDTRHYTLENVIRDYWDTLVDRHSRSVLHEKGVKLSGIQNAYRWGFNLAERIYGKHSYGTLRETFNDMLTKWHNITKAHDPRNLMIEGAEYGLREIRFTVDTRPKDKPRITTKLVDDVWREYPLDALIGY